MEMAWATTKISKCHIELKVLKRKVEELDFNSNSADQDAVDTHAFIVFLS